MHADTEWAEIVVSVHKHDADAVANFLIEQGSTGIVEEHPKTRADIVVLKAYVLNRDDQAEAVTGRLRSYLASLDELEGAEPHAAAIGISRIPDEDWNKKWKSFFQPVKVTDRLVIKPSWQNYWEKPGEIIVELDPGMAFGTGTHPSTRMCLKVLDELGRTLQNHQD
ncbi:MAG: 50S ribosomal protein L11 methyltransferase, partial [Pseudomonadota bacterium]